MSTMITEQNNACVTLLHDIFKEDLLAVYLYGSSSMQGLKKFSDIDLFVVVNRASTMGEKEHLVKVLLTLSSLNGHKDKRPIEVTIVQKNHVNPWTYPPHFDFQFGEWMRPQFEDGLVEPWNSKEMPDLAVIITQILLSSRTLMGIPPNQILCKVPHHDVMAAFKDALPALMKDLDDDCRNVLLTLARIWRTVATDEICSKPSSASWVIPLLDSAYRPVMERAKAIYNGEEQEYWNDLHHLINPCATFMLGKIHDQITRQMAIEEDKFISLLG